MEPRELKFEVGIWLSGEIDDELMYVLSTKFSEEKAIRKTDSINYVLGLKTIDDEIVTVAGELYASYDVEGDSKVGDIY